MGFKEELKNKAKSTIVRFMRYNQGLDRLLMSIAIIYLSISNGSLSNVIEKLQKDNMELANHVTYVSDSGTVYQYEVETLDVYREKNNVQKVLAKYLIQSAYQLTDEYQKSFYNDPEQLFKAQPDFIEFFKEYLYVDPKTSTDAHMKSYKNVLKDWEQIMTYFKLAINENRLPHVIDKKESLIETKLWDTKDEAFSIRFVIPMQVNSRNNNNAIDEGVTYATIEAKGYFHLPAKTTGNARGMKFTSLKLTHPEIDHSKR